MAPEIARTTQVNVDFFARIERAEQEQKLPSLTKEEIALFLLNLDDATLALTSDRPGDPCDFGLFFGRSWREAEKKGLFKLVLDLYQQGMIKELGIPGTEGQQQGSEKRGVANPGKTLWTSRLVGMGIPQEHIHYADYEARNTKTEGDSFLKIMEENGWRRGIYIANPHQIVRAGLGLVRTINQQGLDMQVFAAVPPTTNWGRLVRGSQGKELKPRWEHINDERIRILLYHFKGDLASFEELFEYLERRGIH